MAVRDVQDLLALEERGDADPGELDLAVSQLQEALFGLNRRLLSERRAEQGPLQGLKNTLGSLKDELFADDDDWDDWSRPARDPWSQVPPSRGWQERGGWQEPGEWVQERRGWEDDVPESRPAPMPRRSPTVRAEPLGPERRPVDRRPEVDPWGDPWTEL
jgi:molecular chaperone DnaK